MKTVIVLELTHNKPLPKDFAQIVAGRAYTMDAVEDAEVISQGERWTQHQKINGYQKKPTEIEKFAQSTN